MCIFTSHHPTFAKGNKQLVLLGQVPEFCWINCCQRDSKSCHCKTCLTSQFIFLTMNRKWGFIQPEVFTAAVLCTFLPVCVCATTLHCSCPHDKQSRCVYFELAFSVCFCTTPILLTYLFRVGLNCSHPFCVAEIIVSPSRLEELSDVTGFTVLTVLLFGVGRWHALARRCRSQKLVVSMAFRFSSRTFTRRCTACL